MSSVRTRKDNKFGGKLGWVLSAALPLVATALLLVPDFLLASGGGGGGGGHHRGGGIGIGIGIRLAPRETIQEPQFLDSGDLDISDDDPSEKRTRTPRAQKPAPVVETIVLRKLVKPRVGFLVELALDIDRTLMELAINEPVKAVQLYNNSLAQAKKKGDFQGQKEAYTNLGHVYLLTGRFPKATESYEKALDLAGKLKDAKEQGITLRNLATAFVAWGDYQRAEGLSLEALDKFTEAGNQRGAQMVLINMGVMEKNRGAYGSAWKNYRDSMTSGKEENRFHILALKNMADLARLLGDYKSSLDRLGDAQTVATTLGDQKDQAEILMATAKVYREWGQSDKALETAQKALEKFSGAGFPVDEAQKLMGDLYVETGNLEKAENYLKEADFDSSLGFLYLLKSDPAAAKKYYETLQAQAQKQDNPDELFAAYTGLGKINEDSKNYKQAETYFTKATDLVEDMRSSLLIPERKNFLTTKISGFHRYEPAKGLVRVALKQKKQAQSIYPGEAIRARDFADNLSLNVDSRYFDVPKEIVEREIELTSKLASVKTARFVLPQAVDQARYADISKEIKALETERNAFIQKIWKDHRDYASVRYPKPVKLEEAALSPDEYVIVYDLLGEGIGIKVLKGRKILDARYLDWKNSNLEQEIAQFRQSFEHAKFEDFRPDLAFTLFQTLLEEPLKQIPAGSDVTIIPDGALALLPFEALVASGRATWRKARWGDRPEGLTYFGDLYPVVYSQSLTAMTLVRNLRKKRIEGDKILVMADPVFEANDERAQTVSPGSGSGGPGGGEYLRLMATIKEDSGGTFKLNRLRETSNLAQNLSRLYGTSCQSYVGLQSNKKTFFDEVAPEMDRYRSVVFATHGLAGNQVPGIMEPVLMLSMIPEGSDGYLKMSEVAGLKMNADVAALTACQTGTGVRMAGEGVISMGRAFQSAGAKSVLMSLWSIAEEPSVLMMEEFFKRLKEGKTKREAWSQATAECRKAGFDHPFFWAAFVMVGEAE